MICVYFYNLANSSLQILQILKDQVSQKVPSTEVLPSCIWKYQTLSPLHQSDCSAISAADGWSGAGLSLFGQVGYGATGTALLIVALWCPQVIVRPSSHPSVIHLRATIAHAAALRKTGGSIGLATQTPVREITVPKQLKLMLCLLLLSKHGCVI